VELTKYLLSLPDVMVLLSNWLCQGLLEKFFGQQHQWGCANENPTAQEFLNNTEARQGPVLGVVYGIGVVYGMCLNVRSNLRAGVCDTKDLSSQPLPKQRKIAKQ